MKLSTLFVLFIGIAAPAAWAGSGMSVVDVYKSPTCGCCSKWVDHLKANGFQVRAHDTQNA